MPTPPQTDVIIIGAGLSGIGAACHLARKNPELSYVLLESRAEIGGTWSLFKYPGIRSDSDMYTFGYSFKTWDNPKSFADAPSIMTYLREAVAEYEVEDKIRYHQKATEYDFDDTEQLWTVTTLDTASGERRDFRARFIFNCTGYYNYDGGYTPDYPGAEDFTGRLIHPQKWPADLEVTDKRVIVIGSGATAVTIIPELAKQGAHVTMLQRSPTYVGALPNNDVIARLLKKVLPKGIAHKAIRTKNIVADMIFFNLCRKFPNLMRKVIRAGAKKYLGDFPVDPHFSPDYKPWEQRFCLAPDGDLFTTIREGRADVVTDHIERFDESGIRLKSGAHLPADIVVSATGLRLLAFGGVDMCVGGEPFDVSKAFVYKGCMLSGLPNFFVFVGYSNASWTLKSDLTSEYISRVFAFMRKHDLKTVTPQVIESNLEPMLLMNLNSGYINRSLGELPKQGNKAPWRVYQNYALDYKMMRLDRVDDGRLAFN